MNEINNESTKQMAIEVDYTKIPLRVITDSCRKRLSISLLPERLFPTLAGIPRDWQGLGELAGFDYDSIQLFKEKSNPVANMLKHLGLKQITISKLINMLEIMERFDVIEDIQPLLENDANDYLMKQKHDKPNVEIIQHDDNSKILSKVPRLSKTSLTPSKFDQSCATYDAYVAYSESDADFVVELVEKLENYFHLKLFIKHRDMLPGVVEIDEDLNLIMHNRCKKILIVISKESLIDPYCDFQAILAQTTAVECSLHARKIIPIICKPCLLPDRFKHLAKLDYTKTDVFGKFWDRLYHSIIKEMHNPITASILSKN